MAAALGGGWRRGQRQVAGRRWPGTENEAPVAGRLGEDARGRFSPKMAAARGRADPDPDGLARAARGLGRMGVLEGGAGDAWKAGSGRGGGAADLAAALGGG